MPSTQPIERPEEAHAVATQYLRYERPVSALVAVLVVSLFLGVFLATSLLPALAVGALLVIVARAPLVQSNGTIRLRTDDTPESVLEAFTGPTPPVLAFKWGVADEITREADAVSYRVPYLFGVRSVRVTVRTQTETTADGTHHVELNVSVNDQPWSTYTATISPTDDQTSIHVEYTSERKFGLRRLPQNFVAQRYRDEALSAQGYTVIERDARVGI
ncbi:hypothetical protein [Haloferax sp. DFSO52]|uniref:hypothetical protein n=1 Tax=Haloferax sp. DFSO52 TaxID=3388505 RepID=UPI003A8ABDC0